LVVYQIYPRSFQDSDGDGEGDLRGIIARLDHVTALGADAIWLSPFYPSPLADGGYDVADYRGVDPRFGALDDADALIAAAHERGLEVLFDVVPCHTSIEHPWFREHPDWYVWSDRDGPQNNWRATFGGPAWSRDPVSGRWYLHSFYPEQPDLNWRNPEVPKAFGEVLRFWLDRGVDGFRIDALDRILKDPELRDDPPATGPPPLPEAHMEGGLESRNSRNAPDIGTAIAQLRAAVGNATLVGEVYLLSDRLGPYLEHLDACFSFELLHAPWEADRVRAAVVASAATGKAAWVLSNHDFSRLPDRVGAQNVRAAALLLMTLPGMTFIYQGDELGMGNGADGGHDRAGRDPYRSPMPWDDSPHAGFTTGEPWLPVEIPTGQAAAQQAVDPDSMLAWYRELIALRGDLEGDVEMLDAAPGIVAFRRGRHVVALNLGDAPQPAPVGREVTLATPASTIAAIAPGGGIIAAG
jgi:alpha-glucosidase